MNKASFWVGVAQLVVAILTLAVTVFPPHKQAPVCPPPSTHHRPAHHHRMHHRPPHGGLRRLEDEARPNGLPDVDRLKGLRSHAHTARA